MDFKATGLSSQTPVEVLDLLTKKPIPAEQQITVGEIVHVTLKGQLSPKAAQHPHFSWEQIFLAWSGQKPLLICFHSVNVVQIFYSLRQTPVLPPSPPGISVLDTLPKVEKVENLKRNAKVYLRAFFKELRVAVMQSWEPEMVMETLPVAVELLQKSSRLNHSHKRRLSRTIAYDQLVTLPELYPMLH